MRDEKVARPPQGPTDVATVDDSPAAHYLIPGLNHQGHAFRPSDWAERLAGVVALFVDERAALAAGQTRHFARPVMHGGIKSLLIDATLRDACPGAFAFLSGFAIENGLTMRVSRREDRLAVF